MENMIQVCKEGKEVCLKVNVPRLGYTFSFSYDAGSTWAAQALYVLLSEALNHRVSEIRQREYGQGLKDGRKNKKLRKDYFDPYLRL